MDERMTNSLTKDSYLELVSVGYSERIDEYLQTMVVMLSWELGREPTIDEINRYLHEQWERGG